VSEWQVDRETVAIVQPAEDECRNKGIEDGRRRMGGRKLPRQNLARYVHPFR